MSFHRWSEIKKNLQARASMSRGDSPTVSQKTKTAGSRQAGRRNRQTDTRTSRKLLALSQCAHAPARPSRPRQSETAAGQLAIGVGFLSVALLYESPGGNQVDGLPPVPTCCKPCDAHSSWSRFATKSIMTRSAFSLAPRVCLLYTSPSPRD